MALFEVTANDKKIWKEELRDFLPDKIIDIHTHVYTRKNFDPVDPKVPVKVRWPNLVAKDDPIEDLQETYDLPITGVVEPGAREASRTTRNGRIGITGTEATIRSGAYDRLLKGLNPQTEVFSKACPLFVPLVEEGWFKDDITRSVVQRYLAELKEQQVDTLVLGCTHYPFVSRRIGQVLGPKTTLLHGGNGTARETKRRLEKADLLHGGTGCVEIISSDPNPAVVELAWKLLNG